MGRILEWQLWLFEFSWFQVLPDPIPVHSMSVPVQVPFWVHLLPVEPVATDPSLQEKLHSVPYNISVVLVLHPKNTPWVGNDNIGQVTTKQKQKIHYDAFAISLKGGDVVVFRRPGKFVQKRYHVEDSKGYKIKIRAFVWLDFLVLICEG